MDTEKPKKLARRPVKKAVAEKRKDKTATRKPVKRAGPTKADFLNQQEELVKLREQLREQRTAGSETEKLLHAVTTELQLMRAGVGPQWTDQALLQALDGASTDAGPLGAVMTILKREISQCQEEAEALEQAGQREAVPGMVQAARRLKQVHAKVIDLYGQANAWTPDDGAGQRASRYVE